MDLLSGICPVLFFRLVRLNEKQQISNALFFGVTVTANGNRFSENFDTVFVSCWSFGMWSNNVSDSIAAHCLFTGGSNIVKRGIMFSMMPYAKMDQTHGRQFGLYRLRLSLNWSSQNEK
jgi:hypothetical protein